jgi:Arm DNA-binding domain
MPLSDTAIKNAKTNPDKPSGYRLTPSEKNMYMFVHKNGSKYFRLDYRFSGQRKTLALGVYPETSLKEAREKRDIARKQLLMGIDPCFDRKIKKQGAIENTFQAIALEWYEKNTVDKSDSHKKRTLRILNNDLFPWIGHKPIAELKAPELLATLQRIESRNAIETTHRALQISGQIFRYAIPQKILSIVSSI